MSHDCDVITNALTCKHANVPQKTVFPDRASPMEIPTNCGFSNTNVISNGPETWPGKKMSCRPLKVSIDHD